MSRPTVINVTGYNEWQVAATERTYLAEMVTREMADFLCGVLLSTK